MPTPTAIPLERGVYIDKLHEGSGANPFHVILGDSVKEDLLIDWLLAEQQNLAILYELNYWRNGPVYTNTGKTLLSAFIAKLSAVGIRASASHSGESDTIEAVRDYNIGRAANEQLWGFTFEDEFWQHSVGSANRINAFANVISNIDNANARLASIGVQIDFYLGHPTQAEIVAMGQRLNRLFLHDYRLWSSYDYIKSKVRNLSDAFPGGYNILPICSCETTQANGPDDVGNPSLNFSGYGFEGKDALGNVVGPIKSIFDWWTDFCFTPPGGLSSPNCFMAETHPNVTTRITVGGMILFEQSLMRALAYDVGIPNACGVPTNLQVSSITNTASVLTWDMSLNAISYNVRYRQVGQPAWVTISTTNTTRVLTGLIAGTNYEFQVESRCGTGNSNFSISQTWTTLSSSCPLPANLNVTLLTDTTVTLNWDNSSPLSQYDVRYREVGAGSWTTITQFGNSLALTGLNPATDHEFQVRSRCAGSTFSAYTSSSLFSTQSSTCEAPTSVVITALGTGIAGVGWLASGGSNSYTLRYREIGALTWNQMPIIIGTSALITGLTPSTDYEVQVKSNCCPFLFAEFPISSVLADPYTITNDGYTSILHGSPYTFSVSDTVEIELDGLGIATYNILEIVSSTHFIIDLLYTADKLGTVIPGCPSTYSPSTNFSTLSPGGPPTVYPAGPLEICPGGSVVLSSSEASGNTWSTGETTNQITVSNPGTYYVTVNGFQSNLVVVNLATQVIPSIVISGPTSPIANGSPLTFQSAASNTVAGVLYIWEVNGIVVAQNTPTLIHNFNNGDTIRALVQNPSPCSPPWIPSNLLQIQFPPALPKPTITQTPNCIATGGFVTLTSSYPSGNIWSTGENTQSIIVYSPGTYTVQAVDGFGTVSLPSDPVTVVTCVSIYDPPMPRIGADAGYEVAQAYPEELEQIGLWNTNPYSTLGSRIINYGTSLSSLNRQPLRYQASDQDIYHPVTDFDTLWSLATKYYNKSGLYWVIKDVNNLENSFELTPGTTLLIPDLYKLRIQLSEE